MQVTVSTPNRLEPFTTNLGEPYCRIGRALAGGHPDTIAKAVFNHSEIRDILIKKMIEMVDAECLVLCRNEKETSPFKKMTLEQLTEFKWYTLVQELETKAPTLWNMLTTIISHNDKRNQRKQGAVHYPAICMAVATILKERNKNMVGVQTPLSLILFKSHVQKQVKYDNI